MNYYCSYEWSQEESFKALAEDYNSPKRAEILGSTCNIKVGNMHGKNNITCWSFLGFFRCDVVVRTSRSAARQWKLNGFRLRKVRFEYRT